MGHQPLERPRCAHSPRFSWPPFPPHCAPTSGQIPCSLPTAPLASHITVCVSPALPAGVLEGRSSHLGLLEVPLPSSSTTSLPGAPPAQLAQHSASWAHAVPCSPFPGYSQVARGRQHTPWPIMQLRAPWVQLQVAGQWAQGTVGTGSSRSSSSRNILVQGSLMLPPGGCGHCSPLPAHPFLLCSPEWLRYLPPLRWVLHTMPPAPQPTPITSAPGSLSTQVPWTPLEIQVLLAHTSSSSFTTLSCLSDPSTPQQGLPLGSGCCLRIPASLPWRELPPTQHLCAISSVHRHSVGDVASPRCFWSSSVLGRGNLPYVSCALPKCGE